MFTQQSCIPKPAILVPPSQHRSSAAAKRMGDARPCDPKLQKLLHARPSFACDPSVYSQKAVCEPSVDSASHGFGPCLHPQREHPTQAANVHTFGLVLVAHHPAHRPPPVSAGGGGGDACCRQKAQPMQAANVLHFLSLEAGLLAHHPAHRPVTGDGGGLNEGDRDGG